ncbi:MAG TPA: alpha/beta hydrolase [Thermoanaerobaculia bacterium]
MRWMPLLLLVPIALLLASCRSLRPFAEIRKEVPEDRFLRIGEQLVHIEQAGQGEPVILIHGFGASTYAWRKVLPTLAESFRAVAVDLNGFGYTQRPRSPESYTREGQGKLVLDVMDDLGIERAHFVGHSYGGGITLWIASRYPERVRSMVLVDSSAPTYANDRRSRMAALKPVTSLFLRSFALRPATVRKSLLRSFYDDSLVTPELVQAYYERLSIEGATDAYYGLTAPLPSSTDKVELEKIDVPALIVWGENDLVISAAAGKRAADRMPRARFVAFPETGHIPMEERPEELLRIMVPFLKDPGL